MLNLNGKRLLLMGGGVFIKDIRKYADGQGFELIAVGREPGTHSRVADRFFQIDTLDIDAVSNLILEININGIFVGASEVNIRPAIKIAEKTGLPFYVTQKQWDVLSDKKAFKDLLYRHGLPVIQEYSTTMDYSTYEYPVIIKPVDGSGAKGITVCRKPNEIINAIQYAKNFSFRKEVIIEKFLQEMDDVFIRYHLQDGIYSISSSFDKYSDFSMGGFAGMPLIYLHPTKHLKAYIEKIDMKMQALFKELDLKNGVVTLQGFVDENENFFFYEAGYRLGGSQSYIFSDAVNNSNSLHYMINLALSGSMADYCISERDNPYFSKVCCNQYIPLNKGTITLMDGIEKLREMSGILNITEMCGIGTKIEQDGNLNQVCLRMHLMSDTQKGMNQILETIDDNLKICDQMGQDMRMRRIRSLEDILINK